MISGTFHDYYCGIFGYCSKHYIFKQYFLRVDCPFNFLFSQFHLLITSTSYSYDFSNNIKILTFHMLKWAHWHSSWRLYTFIYFKVICTNFHFLSALLFPKTSIMLISSKRIEFSSVVSGHLAIISRETFCQHSKLYILHVHCYIFEFLYALPILRSVMDVANIGLSLDKMLET